jgi:chloramphenicol 3-O phosphotransferase
MTVPITEIQHPPYGSIIVFNGPSSARKSTLSSRLCDQLPKHHLRIVLDAFRNMESANYWDVDKQSA